MRIAICGHLNCADETPSEQLGRVAVEQLLGDHGLQRVCQNEHPGATLDYRSSQTAVEVKEMRSETLEAFDNAFQESVGGVITFPDLSQTWWVMPDTSAAAGAFSERVPVPRLKGIAQRLGPILVELEKNGIRDARKADWRTQVRIGALLHGGACYVFDNAPFEPGIFLAGHMHGHERPYDIDTAIRDRVQHWLDTESSNMRASLAEEVGLRCGVVVAPLRGAAFSLVRSLTEDFDALSALPSMPLDLPGEIQTLVVVAGCHALRFTPPNTWHRKILAL
ncbi:hypothetical protein [Rhodococcus sp. NPDC055024]